MRGCFDDTSIPLLYTKCKSFSVIFLTIFYLVFKSRCAVDDALSTLSQDALEGIRYKQRRRLRMD